MLAFALLAFSSFFALVNPVAVVPVFAALTRPCDPQKTRRIALKASLTACATLVLFALFGGWIFKIFGITIYALKIVGGVIFFEMGREMLQARLSRMDQTPEEEAAALARQDFAITPLAIPMITGPGAITNAMVLVQQCGGVLDYTVFYGAIAAVMLATYFILVYSAPITRRLGPTGNQLFMRVMGLITMVVAVQFVLSGLEHYLTLVFKLG
jgi:multiple antibiotic resistance protein